MIKKLDIKRIQMLTLAVMNHASWGDHISLSLFITNCGMHLGLLTCSMQLSLHFSVYHQKREDFWHYDLKYLALTVSIRDIELELTVC